LLWFRISSIILKIRYWDIEKQRPYELVPARRKLPSDSTYREDLLMLKYQSEDAAQVSETLIALFDLKRMIVLAA
jgi:hypothetical protein